MKKILMHAVFISFSSAAVASPPTPVYAWGDSLTYGVNATDQAHSWPTLLAQKMNRPVINLGYPGQTSTGIAERFGAIPLRLLEGGEIPPTGAVKIRLANVEVFDGYSPLLFPVSLEGVAGDIRERPVQEFTRANDGQPVKFAPGVILDVVAPHSPGSVVVIWACRNDMYRDWSVKACLDNISAIVEKSRMQKQNFMILSVLTAVEEKPENSRYEKIYVINKELKKLYPENFLDIRQVLIDKKPENGEIISSSFRTRAGHDDGLHLNDSGYEVVAEAVAKFITMHHW